MVAAIGIVFSFVSIIQAIGFWFGYGSGNAMSKKIGEKDYAEAEMISSIGIFIATVTGTVIAIAARIFIVLLATLIGGSASPDVLTFTVQYLNIIIISVPFSLYAVTVYNQLRLCGNVRDGMIAISRQGLFYVPLLYILSALYGKTGIYLLQPVSDVLSFLLAVAVVYGWYRKIRYL